MKIARLGLFGSEQELFLLLYWKVKFLGLAVLCLILNLGMICVLRFGFKGKEVMVLYWNRNQHRRSDCSGKFLFLKEPFGLT